ncbi:MurR/RpiR family transcriptional regulator [Streptococcus hillyeri]|uniref:MurR/RpiR family transcriptional regulator n=1 Tax=Streptococcus hillyeri TaxID=2282420 RepID=A0A3L9DXR4_9STRE|nr:MurR/RpiR family transcriptional regulator [Streptococcus hillyeri]RLY03982.1 MurR/RpiR family transcriptional regulator [Streptococcus hillyeri]
MLQAIKDYTVNGQTSKAVIAAFLLENLGTIEHFSLEELATATFTSKASLVRFAQSLGYKGWTDFLPALIAERYYSDTHYSDVDHNLPFNEDDDITTIIQKIATVEKESIQDTADKIKPEDLDKATDLIKQAKRVVLFGLSPNEYLGYLFRRKMLTIGKVIEIGHSGEFGLTSSSLQEDDLAIIISYSGNSETMESLRYIPLLKANKTKIIALTSESGDLLKEAADTTFLLCTKEDKFKKIGNFSTEESILFILNTLYATYFKKDFFSNYVKKVNLSSKLEQGR